MSTQRELARLEFTSHQDVPVCNIAGELDASNVDDVLARVLRAISNDQPGVVLDLTATTYLDSAGAVRAVAGYRYYDKLHSGRNLYVDDLVTDSDDRSRGYGGKLLAWLNDEARAHGCVQLELDSGVQRFDAHRFYFRERMHVSAYYFVIPIKAK